MSESVNPPVTTPDYSSLEACHELWSVEAWNILLGEAQQVIDKDIDQLKIAEIENARRIYHRILKQFPTAGKQWASWIDLEMKLKNYEKVEKMFGECLSICLHVDLFRLYIDYIRKTKEDQLAGAFEFALQSIGMDILSGPIWTDYITFLRSLDVG
jgi:cleavage stimulation factor subunit 3